MRPTAVMGYMNSGGGSLIAQGFRVITGGRPTGRIGDPITPHPCGFNCVHITVVGQGNPRVLCQGPPINRMGDLDACGHVRVMGVANVLS